MTKLPQIQAAEDRHARLRNREQRTRHNIRVLLECGMSDPARVTKASYEQFTGRKLTNV